MKSETALRVLPLLLGRLEAAEGNQQKVNDCYADITELILGEVESSLKGSHSKCKQTKQKEYWDLELSVKWKQIHHAECEYRKCRKTIKNPNIVNNKRVIFK